MEELHRRGHRNGRTGAVRLRCRDRPRKEDADVEHAAAPAAPAAGDRLRAPVLPDASGAGASVELIVFLLAWVVALIVTVAADEVGWGHFLTATTLISAAFIISRGIAKAGKVFEGR